MVRFDVHVPGCPRVHGYAATCDCGREGRMTSHTEACELTERAAHLMRLGLAVDMARNKGCVEVLIRDLDDTAHALSQPDLAHAVDKGGDELGGPVELGDEPGGDAMRWEAWA